MPAAAAAIVPPLAIRTQELRISGMSESDLDQTICADLQKYENPATTFSRITATCRCICGRAARARRKRKRC